jgi:NADH-quinone oxidoreductase subunit C
MSAIPPANAAAAAAAAATPPPSPLSASLQAAVSVEWPQLEIGQTREGTAWLRTPIGELLRLVNWLKDRGYNRFLDCTVVDEPTHAERFDLQYLLYSMADSRWLRLKARTAAVAPSLTPVFAAADWYEREAFDLFGVHFSGHPGLRRILLPDDFEGQPPLRRDVPMGSEPIDFTVTRELYGT